MKNVLQKAMLEVNFIIKIGGGEKLKMSLKKEISMKD